MSRQPTPSRPVRPRPARVLSIVLLALALLAGLAAPADATGKRRAPRIAGMVYVESNQSFETSWDALIAALDANPNIGIVATIDHAAAAASVGLDLDPNRVVVFGNPALGSPLMAINQTAGLDLPQRIHLFERRGRVFVGFNDTTFLAARHRLGDAPTLDTIAGALRALTAVAIDGEVDAEARGSRWFRWRPGLITRHSDADVDTTWNRLLAAIDASPASVVFTVDHEANADRVGIDLRPTRVVVFGSPNIGTPLMQKRPTAGIDLPLKILVWEDEHGRTRVTTNGLPLARRHGLRARDLTAVETAIDNFLTAATTTP
ncbi:MAG: DUF302 domain-containing protein [Actinomycetota bacterium]